MINITKTIKEIQESSNPIANVFIIVEFQVSVFDKTDPEITLIGMKYLLTNETHTDPKGSELKELKKNQFIKGTKL